MNLRDYSKLVTYWVTKDGRRLFPRQISDDHLEKILALICRWHRIYVKRAQDALLDLPWPSFNGEMAQMYAEHEFDVMSNNLAAIIHSQPGQLFPIYDTLQAEKQRRARAKDLAWWQKR